MLSFHLEGSQAKPTPHLIKEEGAEEATPWSNCTWQSALSLDISVVWDKHIPFVTFVIEVIVQLLSHVPSFATPWTAALQHFLCPPLSPGVCSDSCQLNWWCYLTILFSATQLLLCLQSFPAQGLLQWVCPLHQVAKILELQQQFFQWIFRVDFLQDWLVWSPCSSRDFQEYSLAPQFGSINSSVLSLLYCPNLTSIHDCWKNRSFNLWCLCFLIYHLGWS